MCLYRYAYGQEKVQSESSFLNVLRSSLLIQMQSSSLGSFYATYCRCFLTEHPHIAGRGEPPEVDALWRHPLDGQFALGGLVVGIIFDPAREPKVGQFDAIARGHQDVAGGDVPVA